MDGEEYKVGGMVTSCGGRAGAQLQVGEGMPALSEKLDYQVTFLYQNC